MSIRINMSSIFEGTRSSLQILALVDGVLLFLPLSILASSSSSYHSESCGWTTSTLHTICLASLCCFCFSFILMGTQLIVLCAAGPLQSNKFASQLRRHLPLPILITA